ncbi:hypothetical protein [Methanobrevibacter sp.]|uniref:hypothetical protein n=1 Tax=Methanobrevibacter sp. TaxID=66852 RepID=UPI00388DC1DD
MNILYSLFYWSENGRYVFSRTKFLTIVAFLVGLVASITTPLFLFPVIAGAALAIPVFVVGFLVHKILKIDSGFYEGNLLSDIKHFLFYWHNNDFEISKTKVVTVAFILMGMVAGLGSVISGAPSGFALGYNLVSLFFAVPVCAVGYGYHKIKTHNAPQIKAPEYSERKIEKTAQPIETSEEPPKVFKDKKEEIEELKKEFDQKESQTRELIAAKFTPPQLTYDRFIHVVDNCEKLFNQHYSAVLNLINFSSGDSQKIDDEIASKTDIMKSLIGKLDDLSSELAISMSKSKEDDVHGVLSDMENLISSIDDY